MKNFKLIFEGHSTDRKHFGCGMTISGVDYEAIGTLLADYILSEAAEEHYEPLKVFQAMIERAANIAEQGGEKSKIILPKGFGLIKPN